jgi:hypothetical protein
MIIITTFLIAILAKLCNIFYPVHYNGYVNLAKQKYATIITVAQSSIIDLSYHMIHFYSLCQIEYYKIKQWMGPTVNTLRQTVQYFLEKHHLINSTPIPPKLLLEWYENGSSSPL